ncbi:MAG TPA: hypothetical protein VEG44_10420 [Candidatus Acidoferrales bacterium]|nr:hypothetical protein [Candidatus Acidoferrales bacterium]
MDKVLKRLLIALVVLIILVPIGLLATYGGEAYGEWSPDSLQKLVGYVPAGLQSISGLWNAPLSGYGTPATPPGFFGDSLGYYLSAVVGVVIIGGAVFLLGKAFTNRDIGKNNE